MPRKKINYAKKEKSSKSTYVNFFDILIKSGKSLSVIKRIPNTRKGVKSFNKLFGTHLKTISSLKGKKSLIKQIKNDINPIVSEYIEKQNIKDDKYKTFLYNRSYELLNVKEKELKKIKEIPEINKIDYKELEKEGQYGIIKIIDLKNENEYWIKYKDKKSLNKHLEKLKRVYKIKNFISKVLGLYMYRTYIENEFKKKLVGYNLS